MGDEEQIYISYYKSQYHKDLSEQSHLYLFFSFISYGSSVFKSYTIFFDKVAL